MLTFHLRLEHADGDKEVYLDVSVVKAETLNTFKSKLQKLHDRDE